MQNKAKPSRNPQKQLPLNIVGYLDSSKLFKQTNQGKLPPKRKNQKRSPAKNISVIDDEELYQKSLISGRHTFLSQNVRNEKSEKEHEYLTARDCKRQKQSDLNVQLSNDTDRQMSSRINVKKNPHVIFAPRNRFYYREQQNQDNKQQQQINGLMQKVDDQQLNQHGKLFSGYFSRLNQSNRTNYQTTTSYKNTHRSKSPLQESHQLLFSKFYKQTYNHLKLMINEINKSQEDIQLCRKEITQKIYNTIKQRSVGLREQLIDLVEEIVTEWEKREWSFIKNIELEYLDDLLEVEQQLNEREIKVEELLRQLDNATFTKSMIPFEDLSSSRKVQKWKNITADLLLFDYDNTIIELQQLTQKISHSINQKCSKAISLLPSTKKFQKSSHYQIISSSYRNQLKNQLLQFLSSNFYSNLETETYTKSKPVSPIQNFSHFTINDFTFKQNY